MRLAYKIPHKVTARMVGPMFVAVCSCKGWTRAADPRKRDDSPWPWLSGFIGTPAAELIKASHEHATDHVLEGQGVTRKVAA